jgi:hypothetical protein
VVATTLTDRQGRYFFDQFGATGDYRVRLVLPATVTATTGNPREFLISAGDETERVDFGIRLAAHAAAGSAAQESAAVVAAVAPADPEAETA